MKSIQGELLLSSEPSLAALCHVPCPSLHSPPLLPSAESRPGGGGADDYRGAGEGD